METYQENTVAFCWTETATNDSEKSAGVNGTNGRPAWPMGEAVGIFNNREQDLELGLETLGDHPYAQVWAQAMVGTMGREVQRWHVELAHIEDKLAYYQDAQHEVLRRLEDAERTLARMESTLNGLEAKRATSEVSSG
jgi:hypothetical protein